MGKSIIGMKTLIISFFKFIDFLTFKTIIGCSLSCNCQMLIVVACQATADVSPYINAKHTILTIFRSSEADRRSAFKSSSRFWLLFAASKSNEETVRKRDLATQ